MAPHGGTPERSIGGSANDLQDLSPVPSSTMLPLPRNGSTLFAAAGAGRPVFNWQVRFGWLRHSSYEGMRTPSAPLAMTALPVQGGIGRHPLLQASKLFINVILFTSLLPHDAL